MKNENAADLLDSAADSLERNGWRQGRFHAPHDERAQGDLSACLMGAMFDAQRLTDTNGALVAGEYRVLAMKDAWEKLVDKCTFEDRPHEKNNPIADWNDAAGRTQQEALDLLRECAKELRP